MSCAQARRLFGAYWDDEATQAEREWLESHFTRCSRCRAEYEELARSLELTSGLPREEAAPDLVERVLARARRTTAAPDWLPAPGLRWVPATAAAALLAVGLTLIVPWMAALRVTRLAQKPAMETRIEEPRLVAATPAPPSASDSPASRARAATMAAVPDSLFDHSEDVEFILDPVVLRRGRAHTVSRLPQGVQAEQAVITF